MKRQFNIQLFSNTENCLNQTIKARTPHHVMFWLESQDGITVNLDQCNQMIVNPKY
jgi:hypothetical protein